MVVKDLQLDDKYTQSTGRVYMTGSQALARLPMLQQERDRAAGLNTAGFISGYRGSPLGGLDKTLWQAQKYLRAHNVHFQPGVNEELAATAVWGSQQVNLFEGARYDGVFGMWYGKGPGVDRSGDVFKHANHAGTSKFGGVLAIAGDDHGCKSSTLPHQTEYAFVDAMIPVLNPAGVQEIIDFGLYGWAMSRFSGCWVALKTIAETVDAAFSTQIDKNRLHIQYPSLVDADVNIRWPDKPLDQEVRLHNAKLSAVLAFARANHLNSITLDTVTPRLGIVATGKSWLDVMQALDDLGIDSKLAADIGLRIMKVGMPWPLESTSMRDFAQGLDEVIVVEEKRGLIEDQLTSQMYNWHSDVRPIVVGKHDETGRWLLPSTGELTPAMIARVLAGRIARFYSSSSIKSRLEFLAEKERYLNRPKALVERLPHFCSGCPHNTSTRLPAGSRAMGGIGCHYMAIWMDRDTETFTQMGGEGATWIGQAPFTETRHVFQNLGDGTYFHSGLLAIRAAIASGHNITYKILYNDAVAMTGGQPLDGELSVARLAAQVRAEGVDRIAVVSEDIKKYNQSEFPAGTEFADRDDLESVQCALRACSGTSVLIFDQTCAAEKRRRRKKGELIDPQIRPVINTAVCEGCGDCGLTSNCLSVVPDETEYGRKRKIDQSACNKDMSCIKGFCPSFVTVEGGRLRRPDPTQLEVRLSELPMPSLPSTAEPYGIVLAGVGGTGVTTLGAILGIAAHLEDKGVSVLDMTGLAQKFGAVITHLQIADDPGQVYAARIAAGGAQLIIGCDLVVAASNDCLAKVERNRATAIINDHEAMTAEFTRNPDSVFPADSMHALIEECTGDQRTYFFNASAAAEQLLGSTMATNILLAGYAWQRGLIPISNEAIVRAIELNGASVKDNLLAFNLGRQLAFDPSSVHLRPEKIAPLKDLEAILADRRAILTAYQGISLANRYEAQIRRFQAHLAALNIIAEPLLITLAQNYFKLLAYKDEYEVARLYSNGDFKRSVASQFEGNYRLKFHLAPPLLAPRDRHTGLPRKLTLGGWMMPMFSLLARLRVLRGTVFDPFGYTQDRRLERELIHNYEILLDQCLLKLTRENVATVQALLGLPEKIRGYGHVKRQHVDRAQQTQLDLLAKLDTQAQVVRIVDPSAA